MNENKGIKRRKRNYIIISALILITFFSFYCYSKQSKQLHLKKFLRKLEKKTFSSFSRKMRSKRLKKYVGKGTIYFFGGKLLDDWVKVDRRFFSRNKIKISTESKNGGDEIKTIKRFTKILSKSPNFIVFVTDIFSKKFRYQDVFDYIIDNKSDIRNKNIEIYVCNIMPYKNINKVNKKIKKITKRISDLNFQLKSYCKGEKLHLIDFYSVLKNKHKGFNEKYTKDGIFCNKKGYKMLEEVIANEIIKK